MEGVPLRPQPLNFGILVVDCLCMGAAQLLVTPPQPLDLVRRFSEERASGTLATTLARIQQRPYPLN
jgi:hypothetical protein